MGAGVKGERASGLGGACWPISTGLKESGPHSFPAFGAHVLAQRRTVRDTFPIISATLWKI